MIHCQLWMGSLEQYMTETFIMQAFKTMGENPQSVKIMRNKYTGEPAGYCFVQFANDDLAVDAMHKLNGKPIPGSNPMVRFRLNNASNAGRASIIDREFSVWVGDLSPDVDDYTLYRCFSSKYNTIKTAKVILDNLGFSKGYGFVRFGSEDEQKDAMETMNGFRGLGQKPLKICSAVPKPKGSTNTKNEREMTYSQESFSQFYDASAIYWQNYAQWQSYYEQNVADQINQQTIHFSGFDYHQDNNDNDLELIDHNKPLDVELLNRELIDQDRNLWDSIESSKWLPCDTTTVIGVSS